MPPCPCCGGKLNYRDARPRIRKHEGGTADYIYIHRYRCKNCGRYHNALPDCLLPYKHYESDVICGVVDGTITSADMESEDYPSEATMLRWKYWLAFNMAAIECILRSVFYRLWHHDESVLYTADSLLDELREQADNWLSAVIRIIYNTGHRLQSTGFQS